MQRIKMQTIAGFINHLLQMNIVLKTFSTDPVTVGHFETPSLSLRDRLVLESLS